MTKPMIRIHNTETNEVIDREMNNAEFENYEQIRIQSIAEKTEAETKAAAKASGESKLAALGLSAAEIAALTK